MTPLAAGTITSPGLADEPAAVEPVTPLAAAETLDQDRVTLGRKLFHDVRLSGSGTIACASCHDLARGGGDGRARSTGADGRLLQFNSPTVFNASRNYRLNWRGNHRTLDELNAAVLLDPRLMGARWEDVLATVRVDPGYAADFARAYGAAGATEATVLDALATFERSLATPNARFDRYLAGERRAITPEEEQGYQAFKAYGCVACHQGANLGGNLLQRFGVFASPFRRRDAADAELGRFTITGREEDRHVFRVPSLRNVALTAPYLHDGRAASLEAAVEIMAWNQLGQRLAERDVGLIVAFLRTLTGEYQGRPLAPEAGPEPR